MYIRKSKTRSVNDSTYYSYRLVESVRQSNGKVKQQTLLNLGSNYSFPEDQWPLLSDRVNNILTGALSLFTLEPVVENEAQRLANLIIHKHGCSIETSNSESVHESIDINSVENSEVKSIGAEFLAFETANALGLHELLLEVGLNKKQADLSLASIIGRLLSPGSDVSTCNYLRNNSALDEVMDVDFSSIHKRQMYESSDLLWKHKDQIESKLYNREKDLFKFEEMVTLYDLTNTYFEGESRSNDNAAFGRSKEKRCDCKLVTLALVLDSSGFPKKSHIFKGNVSEGTTLKEMVSLASKEAIVIMDAGIATEENIEWLSNNNYKYLVISRKRNKQLPGNVDGVEVKSEEGNKVTAYIVKPDDSSELEMYCHSESMERRADTIKDKFKERFLTELKKLSEGLTKKGCMKKYTKIIEKIGKLKERHKLVSHLYNIEVSANKDNKLAEKITWEYIHDKNENTSGIYCIRTNQQALNHQEVWDTYRMLNDIEAAFRILKTDLGLRPIYHQKTDRISGHIFISLLAYHLLHTIRYQLKNNGIHDSWATIHTKLVNHFRITTSMQKENGKVIHIRKSMRPNPDQLAIYQACGVNSVPLNTIISKY